MEKGRRNLKKMLVNRAKKLVDIGYSVIPIQGDSGDGEPKKPTIRWRAYQKRIADAREVESWFDGRALGLGVVCGRVSELLVIDFDDHLRYQRFCRHLPQIAASFTVKTRRGYHMYFRTSEKVPSHQFDGGDIKGEKSYVLAPPSVIAGFKYKVVRKCEARRLDRAGVDSLLTYLHVRMAPKVVKEFRGKAPGPDDIVALYARVSQDVGRNNALYHCAAIAARAGMTAETIEKLLVERHVWSRSAAAHKAESVMERWQEARRTIASASRGCGEKRGYGDGIPNSARERLLRSQGSAVTARFLDIMQMAGWQSESCFYMCEAIAVCREYGLNRKSVFAALTGEFSIFNGRHIVSRRYVEYLDIGGLKGRKAGRRPELVFQMPSVSRLLAVLGVSWSPSDMLVKRDVRSSHAYRLALHREYVKRLSPRAPMSVLAVRLGVSARSVRRYNMMLGVWVRERIGRFALSWENLKCLPKCDRKQRKKQTPGYWLAAGGGRRVPAWRHVGAALLRRGEEAVEVCVRRPSILSLGGRSGPSVAYESLSTEMFMRIRVWRGERVEGAGLLTRLRGMAREARARAGRVRYEKVQLRYDTVGVHLADDKVAESIHGYLVAEDASGAEVRRPALRGVAYRMLKEFGEGKVYLSLRDAYGEMMEALAGHALRAGDRDSGVGFLARSLA